MEKKNEDEKKESKSENIYKFSFFFLFYLEYCMRYFLLSASNVRLLITYAHTAYKTVNNFKCCEINEEATHTSSKAKKTKCVIFCQHFFISIAHKLILFYCFISGYLFVLTFSDLMLYSVQLRFIIFSYSTLYSVQYR